jgi:hypothetical protein
MVELGEPPAVEVLAGAPPHLMRFHHLAVAVEEARAIMEGMEVPEVVPLEGLLQAQVPLVREIAVEREKPGIREEPAIFSAVVAGHPQLEERPQV